MIGPSIMKNIGPELKTTIYSLNGTDLFSLTATGSLLTDVDQGPAINQRIGNMINCKRIRIRMNTNATSVGGSGTTKFEFDFCRVVLLYASRVDSQPISTFFYVGQGAVFTVFHSKNAVEKLGLEPKAELIGAYSSSESGANAIGQREDGQGYSKAIQGAVAFSKVNPADISIVKTHGTGTPANNSAEKNGITSVLNDFVATSYKQKIGHTVAASGLLETCLLLDDIKSGQIPAIENRTEDDRVFLSKPCDVPDGLILSLAAGMGNIYSAAIFKGL